MSQSPKRHLDRFTRFCTAHSCAQHTDTQITLRATSVAIRRIYAKHAMQPKSALSIQDLTITDDENTREGQNAGLSKVTLTTCSEE